MKLACLHVRLLTVALLAANVAAAAFIGMWLWQGTEAPGLLATPARELAAPVVSLAEPQRAAALHVLGEQPLFHASRKIYVAPEPNAAAAAPPPPAYRLAGTLAAPQRPTVALLTHTGTGEPLKVRAGEALEGWQVQAIERTRVVLSHGQEQLEITVGGQAAPLGLGIVPLARGAKQSQPQRVQMLGSAAAAAAPRPPTSKPNTQPRLYRPPPQ